LLAGKEVTATALRVLGLSSLDSFQPSASVLRRSVVVHVPTTYLVPRFPVLKRPQLFIVKKPQHRGSPTAASSSAVPAATLPCRIIRMMRQHVAHRAFL